MAAWSANQFAAGANYQLSNKTSDSVSIVERVRPVNDIFFSGEIFINPIELNDVASVNYEMPSSEITAKICIIRLNLNSLDVK